MYDQRTISYCAVPQASIVIRRWQRRWGLRLSLLTSSLLLAAALLGAEAAEYYFAAHGNDSHLCTPEQPCRSTQKITALLTAAKPDDVFYLRGNDVFDGNGASCLAASNVDGHPGHPITITTYGTGRAVLQNCAHGVIGKRTDWWVIENLEVKNSQWGIGCIGCQDWVVYNSSFHDLRSVCVRLLPDTSAGFTPSARWHVSHSLCHDTGLDPTTNGEGFYLISVQDITIEHTELFNLRDEGVNCKQKSNNIVVRNNYFHDFFPPGASHVPADGFRSRLASLLAGWLVPQAQAGGNPSEDTAIHCRFRDTSNVIAERNVIEQIPYVGVSLTHLQTAITRHNLVVGSGVGAIQYAQGVTGQIANNTLYNNAQAYRISVPITPQDNIAWANGRGNDPTDPQFVKATGGDFNLAAHSDRLSASSDHLSQGVFHSPTLKTCIVGSVSANTVRCEVGPIRFAPLRCPDPTAFTITVNGVAHQPPTACTVVTDTVIDIGFQGTGARPGDSVTLSASYGALQDSAWIGGRALDGECLAAPFVCNSMSLPVPTMLVAN